MSSVLRFLQLTRIAYAEGLHIMNEIVAARKAGRIGGTLLLLEHLPVLTPGPNTMRASMRAELQ